MFSRDSKFYTSRSKKILKECEMVQGLDAVKQPGLPAPGRTAK
jgi:hypothetical protein